jgi:hypothetical protein
MALTPALFTSTRTDDTDPNLVQVSHWNRVTGLLSSLLNGSDTDGKVLVRDSTDVTKGATWTASPTLTTLTLTTLTAPGSSDGILFEAATPRSGDATRKTIIRRWNPVGAAADPSIYFTADLTGFANLSSQDNHVYEMGHNLAVGGGLLNASYSGIRDAWESYYEPTLSGTGYWERHIAAMPTDVATHGEIRPVSISGRANVTRDNVHPSIAFQGDYFAFTYPSTAGAAYGDSVRITLDGTTFGAAIALNNSSSYIIRSGVSKGSSFPLFFQANVAQNANIPVLFFGAANPATDDDLHLLFNTFPSASVVHVGIGGAQSRFVVDGRNAADNHALLLFREEQGAGNKDSFIGVDATTMYIGAPQTRLGGFTDTTIAASAHVTLTSALLTVAGGIKHGSTTLLQTSVGLTNGAASATATLTNAPTAGNPTKWIPITDNGTTRYIPAW